MTSSGTVTAELCGDSVPCTPWHPRIAASEILVSAGMIVDGIIVHRLGQLRVFRLSTSHLSGAAEGQRRDKCDLQR